MSNQPAEALPALYQLKPLTLPPRATPAHVNRVQTDRTNETQFEPGSTDARSYSPDALPIISFAEKEQIEREHWKLLREQLIDNKLEFKTGPLQSHVQFSNFCNLSCIMCWNGQNPRTEKISDKLLEKINTQLAPHLSIIVPFSGSEPLILTWNETRQMAERYGVMLRVTTNLQFLDESKFNELKDITETLCVSVDCHIPGVLAKIRQRAKTDTILKNLELTARLARENGIECIANVVLLTHNAPFLSDTIRYFHSIGIENVDVIQMVDINHDSHFHDPLIHCSEEYISHIKAEAVLACKETGMRLMWNVGSGTVHDFRTDPVPAHPRKVMNDHNDWLLKHYVPGFCKHAYNRLRFDIDGDLAPCFLATEGQLSLGNLNDHDFEEIWNGVNARDLRRGMYTDDVPALCKSCRIRNTIPSKLDVEMPFTEAVKEQLVDSFFKSGIAEYPLEVQSPEHNLRSQEPPSIEVTAEINKNKFLLAFGLGGSTEHVETQIVRAGTTGEGQFHIEVPATLWKRLKPNLGYWWTVWQYGGRKKPVVWCKEIRCLIRHQSIPRIEGSTLGYADEGHQPITNLGVDRTTGFAK